MQFLPPRQNFTARSFEELQQQLQKMYDDIYREIARFDSFDSPLTYTEVSSFSNSWQNLGSGWQNAAYTKTADGWVSLIGLISSGTLGSAAFTLPTGYRPASTRLFMVMSWDHEGKVDVDTSGNVIPKSPCENGWVSLDNIWFYAG